MKRPAIWGVNHLKLAAKDVKTTQVFYTDVVGLEYIPEFDHKTAQGELFAVMLKIPHNDTEILVEVRHNQDQAEKQQGWDPITWGVRRKKDLDTWRVWFEERDVKCSKVFTGLKGWVLCALGKRVGFRKLSRYILQPLT